MVELLSDPKRCEGIVDSFGSPTNVHHPDRLALNADELTEAGRKELATLLAEPAASSFTDDGFGVYLALFDRTPAEARLRVLEGRRRVLEARREEQRGAHVGQDCREVAHRGTDGHGHEDSEAAEEAESERVLDLHGGTSGSEEEAGRATTRR